MNEHCPFCDGVCAGAEFGPLFDQELRWLWERVAYMADRRGDARLDRGTLTVRAPESAQARAAASGLLGSRVLKPGQSRVVDLAELTLKLRVRGPNLTPGAVAAHVLNRRLAEKAAAQAERRRQEERLKEAFLEIAQATLHDALREPDRVWAALRRSGWIGRILNSEQPSQLVRTALGVLAALPAQHTRVDRRRLASDITGNPHALDSGTTLAGLVLAMLTAGGIVAPRQPSRVAWASIGISCDDVTGGLTALGVIPVDWRLPAGAIVTLPPRVLSTCEWPSPETPGSWIFVTENPSVLSAAADDAANAATVRLLCTNGTPSAEEVAAIARLASAGWRVAVRADFDVAGLSHVTALLATVPDAIAWRMGVADYFGSLSAGAEEVALGSIPDVGWDRKLSDAMRERGLAAYEESLLPLLLEDLRAGVPTTAEQVLTEINDA